MAPHDFYHDHALMRFRGISQAVDLFKRDIRSRIEAERIIGQIKIVVHRLRNADGFNPVLMVQFGRDAERVSRTIGYLLSARL